MSMSMVRTIEFFCEVESMAKQWGEARWVKEGKWKGRNEMMKDNNWVWRGWEKTVLSNEEW